MRIIKTVAAMQRLAKKWRGQGVKTGLVPTMGYLHEGHLSLVRHARKLVGAGGRVIVTIYVNPTQFAPTEDLSRYPRDFARDAKLCRQEGADVIFAPDDKGMYPDAYSTFVVEEALSRGMEGASRPTHFRGVTTIVAKLFNITLPDVAVFGAKDFQQAAVIRRMTQDLNFPLKIVVASTVREPDGLAMSSRNKYLTPEERGQALVLHLATNYARAAVKASAKPLDAPKLREELTRLIAERPAARVDYVEFFDAETLQPTATAGRGTHLALAVFIGQTRLIDNARL